MDQIEKNMLLLDRMNDPGAADPLRAFALDELLCRGAGAGGPAVCHIWRHPKAFIMGSKDGRLPQAAKAQRWVEDAGWATMIRNSGGAAVPLDLGVVNLSLILPNSSASGSGFHADFERMYTLVAQALRHSGRRIDKGEVAGAYCPGDYDLSIGGYKFCGIAQRRQVNAFIIQAFVVAEGSGRERAEFVRAFYDIASGGDTSLGHPVVSGDSTASLEELAGLGAQAASVFADNVKDVIRNLQTPEGVAEASARLRMPSGEEVDAMARLLRSRYAIGSSAG